MTGAAPTLRLEALILAGGAGRRFGAAKLLAPYRDGRLIDGALRCALAAPVVRTTVVTGFDAERVADTAVALAKREGKALRIVHAEQHVEGMAATLRQGIAALSPETEGVFIFLGDMPDIPKDVPHIVCAGLGPALAAAPVFEGRRGHPVLLTRALFPKLAGLKGDAGARGVLDDLGDGLAQAPVSSPGILFDVDQPSDLVA